MERKQIPCINCITLPVCKSITNKVLYDCNKRGNYLYSYIARAIIRRLIKKCILIKRFCKIDRSNFVYLNRETIKTTDYLISKKKKE